MDGDGGGLGLKVKITPVIDRSQLNSEGKKVENQLNKNIKLSGTGGFAKNFQSVMPKSMKGGPGSLFEGLGAKLGGSGIGKAAVAGGVAGLVVAGVQGILEILKKVFSLLVEASPMLKNVLKMLNMGFMMILRPIGDALAMMLRPIAMFFRAIGRQVMKQVRAKRAELKSQGYSGGALGAALMEEMPRIYLQVLIGALQNIDWGDLWDKYLDLVWKNITERFPAFLATLWQGFLDMRQGLIDALSGVGKWLYGVIADAGKYGLDKLGGLGQWLYDRITGKISPFDDLEIIGSKIYDIFVTMYNTMAGMLNKIPGVNIELLKTYDRLKAEEAANKYVASYKNYEIVYSATGHAYGYKDREIQYLAGGGEMTSDGLIYAHAGEVVKDSGSIKQMIAESVAEAMASMGGRGDTFVIPGSAIADAIDRRIDYYYKTKVVNRR